MSSKKQQQKEKKKKNREKKVIEKLSKKRDLLRKERKAVEIQRRQEEESQNLVHGKLKPIVNDYQKAEKVKANKEQSALSQLEKNLKILEALENEYDREASMRNEVNKSLESEGHLTMSEKMDALHKKALEIAKNKEIDSDPENLSNEENL